MPRSWPKPSGRSAIRHACECYLATLINMSESAVSHQLRLLRNLRLVKARRDGRMVFYSFDDRHIITLFRQALRHVQEAATATRRARVPGTRTAQGRG
jgi:DNA-binding transcriptional ArsR family regulator